MVIESSFEIGIIAVRRVPLFQSGESGQIQDDAKPSFFPDSMSCISELSNEVSFVSEFLQKGS